MASTKTSHPVLLVRPEPMEGESLRAYLLALADANETKVHDLMRLCWTEGLDKHRRFLARLASLLGRPEDSLPGHWLGSIGARACGHGDLGLGLWRGDFRVAQSVVCTRCLSQCPRGRLEWDLRAVCVCADHGCWLTDQCTKCTKALSWNRPGVCTCACGWDLRRSRSCAAPLNAVLMTSLICDAVRGFLSPAAAAVVLGRRASAGQCASLAARDWVGALTLATECRRDGPLPG